MNLLAAVTRIGQIPSDDAPRALKKRYSETLSRHLAEEIAEGLRETGFAATKPDRGGAGEKAFQGGLGPKKVDVSHADERHGLLLAVSIKSICFAPFGKNLKNRFADMCTEAITLHMRFPYAVVGGFFAFPVSADRDITRGRPASTFHRATTLMASICGRRLHSDAAENFETMTMLLFQPVTEAGPEPWIRLYDAVTAAEISQERYFTGLRELFLKRNPHIAWRD